VTPRPRPRVLPGDEVEAAGVDWQAWDEITARACADPSDDARRPSTAWGVEEGVIASVYGHRTELAGEVLKARLLVRGAGAREVLDVEGMPVFTGGRTWGPAGGGWRRCGVV